MRKEAMFESMFRKIWLMELFCILGIISASKPLSADDVPLPTDDFKVTLLGTGSPVPIPDRFGNSTLVEVGGQRLVFDMGRGAAIRLWQKKIPLGSIDAHFITHLHSDHINGLSDLWLTGWSKATFGGRTAPFVVYGPHGTKRMMANLWKAFSEDRRIRLADEECPLSGVLVSAHEIFPGIVYAKNGVIVTAFEVDHGELVKPAYGYKIWYQNHSVVISGNTLKNDNVLRAARHADLLIHDVAMIPEALIEKRPAYQAIYDHHISPEEAGELFADAKPKLAVYSHITFAGLPPEGIPLPTPEALLAATRTTYCGPLVVGEDLMTFQIDDTGVSIVPSAESGGKSE